jgi:hypothetical protein
MRLYSNFECREGIGGLSLLSIIKNNRILGIFATNGTNRHERIRKFREFVRVVSIRGKFLQ